MSDAESRQFSAPSRRSHTERSTPEGLLPSAAELERYEQLVPGITERLIGRWEQQIEHQQTLFEFGLGLILTGLRAELDRRASRPGGDLSPQDMGDCKP